MSEKERQRRDLTHGPIWKNLLQLTLPMIVGILSIVGFNLVDTYFVGQLGEDQLAALSFTFPVITMIFSLVQGMGIGATALISKSYGKGDLKQAARETTDGLALSVVLAFVFVIIGFFTIRPLFRLLGAAEHIIPLIESYMQIWYLTIMLVVVPFIGNSAIRATGDARTPSLIMVFAVIINAILDPILIFGWGPIEGLGLKGAAIATAISRGFTLLLALYILYFREKLITLHVPSWKILKQSWGGILYIGLPSGLSRMVRPISQGVLTALVANYGQTAVAGFGVGTRIEFLATSVLIALSASIGPFTGQNIGAGKLDRIKLGIKYSSIFSIIWGVGLGVILSVFARPIASIFTESEEVIDSTAQFLQIVPYAFGFQGVVLIVNSNLNTLNKPLRASLLIVIQMVAIYIPLAYLGSQLFDLQGVYLAIAATYFIGGVISFLYDLKVYPMIRREL